MKKTALLLTAGLVLSACGQTEESHEGHTKSASVEPVEVNLTVPDKGEADQKVTLQAKVTQAYKAIKADEVIFEIIKDGNSDDSVKKTVKETEDGIYKLDYTFKDDGSYKVISHVTAKSQHTMPDQTIVVGQGGHTHAHHEGTIHVMPITAEKDKETMVTVHVEDEKGRAKSDAMTRLEVKQPDGKVRWIDLTEKEAGTYEGTAVFKQSGTYEVTGHAEDKEGFHVHTETMFTVK